MSIARRNLAVGKDIGFFPAHQIQLGAGRQELETGLRMGLAAVALQPLGEFLGQRVQVQHVGRGIVGAAVTPKAL